jgi:hypothetical protein
MKIHLDSAYLPSPGATMTPAFLHAMVDNCTLNSLEDSEITVGGSILTSSPASGTVGFVVLANQKLVWAPNTNVSLEGGTRHWFGKAYPAWYVNTHGYRPYKGMPTLIPGDLNKSAGDYSNAPATAWTAGGWWMLPRVSQNNNLWFHWWSKSGATVRSWSKFFPGSWGVMDEENDAQNGLCKILEHGFGQALVHASFSSNLSAPGSYGLLYNATNQDHFPVATKGFDAENEAATITYMGLGHCRKVYTESGITLVPYVNESEASQTNVPYYVAEIFFGGFGCP